jgi:hypothetical protein
VGVDHGSARRFEVQARRSLPQQQITIIHRVMTFSLPRCIMTRLRIPLNWLQEGLRTAALHLTANQLPHCCLRTAAELYSYCCSTPSTITVTLSTPLTAPWVRASFTAPLHHTNKQ